MPGDDSKPGSVWKWIALAVVVTAAAYLFARPHLTPDPNDPALLMQDVSIKCAETGFEWKLNRGRMESYLYQMANRGQLDVSTGLENPKTGKRTGFPLDKADWEKTVARVLKETAEAKSQRPAIPEKPQTPKGN
jgi:hypothetical protein